MSVDGSAAVPRTGGIHWAAVLTLIVTTVAGAVLGFYVYKPIFGAFETVAVVEIGHVGSNTLVTEPTLLLEDSNTVAEELKSASFAKAVAAASGITQAETALPAAQYGGAGALKSRTLRSADQVEIRVSAATPDQATKLSKAVLLELLKQHEALMVPLLGIVSAQVDQLKAQLDQARAATQALSQRVDAFAQGGQASVEYSLLLAARAAAANQQLQIVQALTEAQLLAVAPRTQPTRVIAEPALSRPVLSSPYHTAGLGGVVGLALGMLLLLSRRLIT